MGQAMKIKRGVYVRDWGEGGMELGILGECWPGFGDVMETGAFYYTYDLTNWTYVGEFE